MEYESNGYRNKTLLNEECLDKITPNLKDITNDLKKFDIWKIQLIEAISVISSNDTDEGRVINSKSDNIEILINDKVYEVTEEFF